MAILFALEQRDILISYFREELPRDKVAVSRMLIQMNYIDADVVDLVFAESP